MKCDYNDNVLSIKYEMQTRRNVYKIKNIFL